jgi:chromosome segregation ATPase
MEREEIEKDILLLDLDKKRHERKERLRPVFFSRSMIITCGSVTIAIFSVIAGLQTGAYKKALTEKEISTVNLEKQYAENKLKKVIEEVVLKRNEKDQLSSVVEQLEADKESLEREVSSLNDQKTSLRKEITWQKGVQSELQEAIAEKSAVTDGLISDEKELNKSVKELNETIEGLKIKESK